MIFSVDEKRASEHFDKVLRVEIPLIDNILEVFNSFLIKTNNSIKDTDFPEWTIMIMVGSNLPLLSAAISSLRNGYSRAPLIILRSAAESVIFGMYFKEFPEEERVYSLEGHSKFFAERKGWLEYLLKKIDEEGKIFKNEKLQKNYWHRLLWRSTLDELTKFTHSNEDYIYRTLIAQNDKPDTSKLAPGPQINPKNLLKAIISRILDISLCSILTVNKSLNVEPSKEEIKVIERGVALTNRIKKDLSH